MDQERIDETGTGTALRPRASLVRVSLLFVLFMALFHGILWLTVSEGSDPLRETTTRFVSGLLDFCGVRNFADATHISMRNAQWVITPECTAVNVYILFVSFILAFSSSLRAKLVALAAGVPFIFAANIARLVALGWATEHHPRYARFIHDYAWQAVFVLLVVLMWLVWIELVVRREGSPRLHC